VHPKEKEGEVCGSLSKKNAKSFLNDDLVSGPWLSNSVDIVESEWRDSSDSLVGISWGSLLNDGGSGVGGHWRHDLGRDKWSGDNISSSSLLDGVSVLNNWLLFNGLLGVNNGILDWGNGISVPLVPGWSRGNVGSGNWKVLDFKVWLDIVSQLLLDWLDLGDFVNLLLNSVGHWLLDRDNLLDWLLDGRSSVSESGWLLNGIGGGNWSGDLRNDWRDDSISLSLLGRVGEVSSLLVRVDDSRVGGWNSEGNAVSRSSGQESHEDSSL